MVDTLLALHHRNPSTNACYLFVEDVPPAFRRLIIKDVIMLGAAVVTMADLFVATSTTCGPRACAPGLEDASLTSLVPAPGSGMVFGRGCGNGIVPAALPINIAAMEGFPVAAISALFISGMASLPAFLISIHAMPFMPPCA